jgi:hypothetical protein
MLDDYFWLPGNDDIQDGIDVYSKGQTLDPKTFGQVWYAIAEEELQQSRVVSVASQLTYSHSVIVGWY